MWLPPETGTGSGWGSAAHYEALCRLAGEFPPERIEAVVIDPSAASFIECVESHRVFRVVRADNRVREGIAAVSRWLAEGKLSFDPGCEQCIREFSLYRWEDGGSERPVKEQDHGRPAVLCHVLRTGGKARGLLRRPGRTHKEVTYA